MKIVCPKCGFSRDVASERLPKGSAIVRCPKCQCRFRYAVDRGVTDIFPTAQEKGEDREEEDIRQVASRAYAAEAERFQKRQSDTAAGNPWEMAPAPDGWFAAFYQTVIRVMFQASAFFRKLQGLANPNRAVLFYLIVCVFQTVVEKLWTGLFINMLLPEASGDPQLEKLIGLLNPETNFMLVLLLRCGLLLAQLYIFSFILFLAYKLVAPEKTTFSLILQIAAYSATPAVLCIIPILGSITGMVWGFACLALGCKAALDLDWGRVLFGFLPLLLLFSLFFSQLSSLLSS